MNPIKLPSKRRPEDTIRDNLVPFLEDRGWYVKIMHGSLYQQGIPDLLCCHKKHGIRFVEIKLPNMKGSHWTPAQRKVFPELSQNGCPVWILTGATEYEYRKLFCPENWFEYYMMKD